MPRARERAMMAVVGMAKGSGLYCVLKVAVPRMRGGSTVESGGLVGGMVMIVGRVLVDGISFGTFYLSRKNFKEMESESEARNHLR